MKAQNKIFLLKKMQKKAKRSHAYKGYACTYNVDIFNSLNPEIQLASTEFAIKDNLKN